ncbi:oxygenase MpaB family protein [Tomitella biformata]|uniref:oxygenase MpaB family protein n=1 Tax=Tomitella biformata TaxID=630403 RepID=UPI000467DDE5|nr:oxygenase MpaB family protein [Tomitella biformata]
MAARLLGDQTAQPRLTTAQTRIQITQTTRRWNKSKVDLTDALDFWSFAGGAANVIQQLGWPEVAYGVMESKVTTGGLMFHPWKRARTTFQYLAVAILGTDEERAAFREAVNSVHRHVQSDANSPVKYNAFNRELQMYVAACLFIGFEDSHQLLYGKFTPEQAEHFYQSASPLGTTLQVQADQWPATRVEFDRYWNIACERITMDERTRAYLMDLVHLRMIAWPLRIMFGPLLQFLTAGFLPPLFREELDIEWTETDRRRFENLFVFVSFVNRFIPKFIRGGGTYGMMADVRRRLNAGKNLV